MNKNCCENAFVFCMRVNLKPNEWVSSMTLRISCIYECIRKMKMWSILSPTDKTRPARANIEYRKMQTKTSWFSIIHWSIQYLCCYAQLLLKTRKIHRSLAHKCVHRIIPVCKTLRMLSTGLKLHSFVVRLNMFA